MGTLGVVLDTNVLVSALGFGGSPLDVLLRTFNDEVRLLASEATLDELGHRVRVDYSPEGEYGREWLRDLLMDRTDDGLVELEDGDAELIQVAPVQLTIGGDSAQFANGYWPNAFPD